MVGVTMNLFGVLVGFLLPMIFIDDYEEGDHLTKQQEADFRNQIFSMMIVSAAFSTVITLFVLFSFRDRPGVPIWATKETKSRILSEATPHFSEPEELGELPLRQ